MTVNKDTILSQYSEKRQKLDVLRAKINAWLPATFVQGVHDWDDLQLSGNLDLEEAVREERKLVGEINTMHDDTEVILEHVKSLRAELAAVNQQLCNDDLPASQERLLLKTKVDLEELLKVDFRPLRPLIPMKEDA